MNEQTAAKREDLEKELVQICRELDDASRSLILAAARIAKIQNEQRGESVA